MSALSSEQEKPEMFFHMSWGTVKAPPVPEWAKPWLLSKLALKLKDPTVYRYIDDLQHFGHDLDLRTTPLVDIKQRLGEKSSLMSRASARRMTVTVKQVLVSLGRKQDAETIALPKRGLPRVVVYTKEDIDKILRACRTLRDRLMIEILFETGCRRGELYDLKIKDIQFDEYTPIVWLHGKTGTRTRRVYACKQDVLTYLEQHPNHNRPEAPFWVNLDGSPVPYQSIYKIVARIGRRALNRAVYPHAFRHTAATQDAKIFTDREMMVRYGWRTEQMVDVYAHISQADVDEKELEMRGIKPAQKPRGELIETRKCPACGGDNGPMAIYCQACSKPLPGTEPARLRELEEQVNVYKALVDRLLKAKTDGGVTA
jgi:integrase